ncbi:MAG: hypothetical protein JKY52_03435 [Flavobacteriales bacterium]|nr:hypothetical protein [Flavobacteriales bacterium]
MKNLSNVALMMVFALSLSFVGCKKGENDPFISLKSRDGRITGTWVLSNVDKSLDKTVKSGGSTTSTKTTETFDGTIWTTSGSTPQTDSITYEITIEKDGTWSSIEVKNSATVEESGYWQWTEAKKKKTGLFIANELWTIDRLKNKEMVTINNTVDKDTESNGDFEENIRTDTRTYTKKK